MNDVGFLISEEEDLASGPGTRLDHSRAFVYQSFVKVRKGTDKASDIDIRRGQKECPLTSISNAVIYFLISYYNESKECLEVVKILLDQVP